MQYLEIEGEANKEVEQLENRGELDSQVRASLAIPDDETSDIFNAGDSESREETITTSATVSSQSAKCGTKMKRKKIEGIAQSHSP